MTSRRQQGLVPEFSGLPDTTRRSRTTEEAPAAAVESTIFSSVNRNPRPASNPIPVRKKVVPTAPAAVRETEEAIPLSDKEILRILSRDMPMDRASIVQTFMSRSGIINQQVPSVYSSYFFRKDIIKEFQKEVIKLIPSEKLISFPLSTYNLYNKDDVLNNTMYRPDVIGSRNIEKTSGYSRESQENMAQFIRILSKRICSDIKASYAKSAVERAIDLIKNEENLDILIASTRVIEDVSLPIEGRLEGVVAFVIVELGECNMYRFRYSNFRNWFCSYGCFFIYNIITS